MSIGSASARSGTDRTPNFDLILITEPALADPVSFMRRALQGASAGRVAVQLRAKEWSTDERRDAAHALREIVEASRCVLLINGDAQLCVEVQAHGVQLPVTGLCVAEARTLIGVDRWIGASCHDPGELQRAQEAGADFALLSPWDAVPAKGPALGPERFRSLTLDTTLPVFALGGVGLSDVDRVTECGAHGVAVIREVHRAADPARWVENALVALDRAHQAVRVD